MYNIVRYKNTITDVFGATFAFCVFRSHGDNSIRLFCSLLICMKLIFYSSLRLKCKGHLSLEFLVLLWNHAPPVYEILGDAAASLPAGRAYAVLKTPQYLFFFLNLCICSIRSMFNLSNGTLYLNSHNKFVPFIFGICMRAEFLQKNWKRGGKRALKLPEHELILLSTVKI